jgi:hypothetical protein
MSESGEETRSLVARETGWRSGDKFVTTTSGSEPG